MLGPRRTDKDIKDALKPLTEAVPAAAAGAVAGAKRKLAHVVPAAATVTGAKRKLAHVVAATAAALGSAAKKRKVAVPKSLQATSTTLPKGAARSSKLRKQDAARTSKSLPATRTALTTTVAAAGARTKQTTLEAFATRGRVKTGAAVERPRGPGRPRKDGGVIVMVKGKGKGKRAVKGTGKIAKGTGRAIKHIF